MPAAPSASCAWVSANVSPITSPPATVSGADRPRSQGLIAASLLLVSGSSPVAIALALTVASATALTVAVALAKTIPIPDASTLIVAVTLAIAAPGCRSTAATSTLTIAPSRRSTAAAKADRSYSIAYLVERPTRGRRQQQEPANSNQRYDNEEECIFHKNGAGFIRNDTSGQRCGARARDPSVLRTYRPWQAAPEHCPHLITLARGNPGVQAGEEARPLVGCEYNRR